MTKIKICGITNTADARLIAECGADAAGFIFAASPRRISPEKARAIITGLPPFMTRVGVFKNESLLRVKEIMNYCNLDRLQFHGDEDSSYLDELSHSAIKVFNIKAGNVLEEIKKSSLPFFLLDLPKEGAIQEDRNWRTARKAGEWGSVILAGGLNPGNIEKALEIASPYGVDVCRGVEMKDGEKCPEKVREFIRKVRKWDYRKI